MKKNFHFLFLLILTSFVFGCSKFGDGTESPQTDSDPTTEITDEHIEIMHDVVQSVEVKYAELIANTEITQEELRIGLTDFLIEQNGVKSVEFDGDYTLEVNYDSGLYSYVLLEYIENLMSSYESDDTNYSVVVNNTINDSITSYVGLNTKSNSSFEINNTSFVCNNRVLIWSAIEDEFTNVTTYTESLKEVFENSDLEFANNSGVARNVEYVTNCDLSSFKNITNYGTVILITHGQNHDSCGVALMTNQAVKSYKNESSEINTYLQEKYIFCKTYPSPGERVISSKYWVTKLFVEKMFDNFPNSIIYCGACYSASDKSMSDVFISKGAKTYIGYDNAIEWKKCITNATVFFNALVPSGVESYQTYIPTTTSQAYALIDDSFTWLQKRNIFGFEIIEVTAKHYYDSMYYSPVGQIVGIDENATFVDLYLDTYLNCFEFDNIEVKYREVGNDVDLFTQDMSITSGLKLNNLEPNTEYKIIEANIINGNVCYNNSIYYGNGIVSEDNPITFTTDGIVSLDVSNIEINSVSLDFEIDSESFVYDRIIVSLREVKNEVGIEKIYNYIESSSFSEIVEGLTSNTEYEIYDAIIQFTSNNQTLYQSLYYGNTEVSEDNPITFTTLEEEVEGWYLSDFSKTNYPEGDTWTVLDNYSIYTSGAYTYFSGLNNALKYCGRTVHVEFPFLETLVNYAFDSCDNLTSIDLLIATSVGQAAFRNCDDLTSVNLPAVTLIESLAFRDCDNLTSVALPAVTSIKESAFLYCDNLISVDLPVVTSIGDGVFSSCPNLASITLPVATSIGEYAFASCAALTSVTLPAIISIGKGAFSPCVALASIVLDAKVIEMGAYALGSNSLSYPSSATLTLGSNEDCVTELKNSKGETVYKFSVDDYIGYFYNIK